ncbi:DUF423 domain-containing protein [Rhodospira trueperi]|uniref:Uncharacterized membrane protein YgdD, TMEM256/DUF423 family n=1 Tax=Rhodospira trueperi TaxID=69960 RepID=A0A1G7BPB9_9PROT|nr:DUF423 domain-containing protein [Rhodospira trueperi]SDE28762.1 Uncharacterized membrane protein YgdD, TMEM256/DUF423 family [Rhodospira trueperi]
MPRSGSNAPRRWIVTGAVMGLLSVALGAFGAHGLEARGDPRAVELVRTAAHYQGVHALALVLSGVLSGLAGAGSAGSVWADRAGWLFAAGIVLFCGALYGIALADWPLGPVAPFGGVSFMAGWGLLAVAGWRLNATLKGKC